MSAANATLARLREVWAALGCDENPNDFHARVQQTMWAQALDMIREATARTNRVYRENQQLEEALRVARTAPSSPPAEDVREALDHLDVLNESGRIQYADYVALHEMVSRIEVRPYGTVTDTETPEHLAERYVSAFVGDRADNSSSIVYRGPLLEMVTNAVREARS